jgi:hypothetical protein
LRKNSTKGEEKENLSLWSTKSTRP